MSRYTQDGSDEGGPARSGFGGGPAQPGFAFPPVTPMVKKIMILSAGIWAFSWLMFLTFSPGLELVMDVLGLNPEYWSKFFPFVPAWQLVTYGFMHSVGPMHLIWNMLGLYFFGTMVEEAIGSQRFLVHYLASIAVGGAVFMLYSVATGGQISTIGASGAVYAMICAAATFRPNARVILIMFPIALKWLAIGIVGIGVITGLNGWKAGSSDGVNHLIHVVGGLYGYAAVRYRFIWSDPIQRVQSRRAIAVEDKRVSDQSRVDALLEKIHHEGIAALSKRDKEFLKQTSKRK
ncbi:MAG: membrane associated rhomboid family serine protease [Planctomycetota bacterium]|jgi:membrane associated rhomboid family serine protease